MGIKKTVFIAGCEAVLFTLVRQFHARDSDIDVAVPEAAAWEDLAAIHRAVQRADLVVIGGLLHDCGGTDPDALLTDRHSGLSRYAGVALLATLYRKPVMLYGIGAGPLQSLYGTKLARLAAEAAHAITVRDQPSKALLQELGIDAARIRVTADPAFSFRPSQELKLRDAVNPEFNLRRPALGVAVQDGDIGVDSRVLHRDLASALDCFIESTGGSAVLIPFDDDRAASERILRQMRLRERATVIGGPSTPDLVYGCVKDCEAILGMRMHSLIFAALESRPIVAIACDPKIRELMKRLSIEEFCIDAKDVSGEELASKLAQATKGGQAGIVAQAVDELRKAEADNLHIAFGLLSGPVEDRPLSVEAADALARNLYNRALDAKLSAEIAASVLRDAARVAAEREQLKIESRAIAGSANRIRELEGHNEFLHKRIAEISADCRKLEQENRVLRQSSGEAAAHYAELTQKYARETARFAEDREWLRSEKERLEKQLAGANGDAVGRHAASDIDRYRARLEAQLEEYRSQRAWKVMLACRKAYALLSRSKTRFLKWAAGIPFGRVGDLEEYELRFPDINNYLRTGAAPSPPDSAPPVPRNQYDVIVLAIIDFDFRFQRPQQIAAEFARRGHRVFWISPTRFLPSTSATAYEASRLRENLWEIHLRSRQADIYMGELDADHIAPMSDSLDHLCREWGITGHTIFVQLPFWRKLALQLRAKLCSIILYDCMDDWETFNNLGAFNISEEAALSKECDVLVVTGAELLRKFTDHGLNPVLARNGADFPFFSQAKPNDLLADVPRPVVGYFGAIADWIDLDLIYEIAKSRPQYSFILIGQVFGRDVSRLEALPNVRLLGNKPYSEIPSYLYNFDVCIIPFLINQVTKATDPVKLYEYFSLGKPVVATEMAELKQCGDLVYLAANASDFAHQMDVAISEPDAALRERRIEFAKANTWSSRVSDIDQAIREAFPLVSILIVTHNSAEFLRPCVESILRNTSYPSFEVVFVDNASTDATPQILEEYVARDKRLRATLLATNLGFAGGNNRAAREASGKYLIFLNVDTMVTPGWIERLLLHLQKDPSIGILCPVTNFAGNEIKINVNYTNWREMENFAAALANTKRGEKIVVAVAPLYCALMPRAVWERIGEMDTRYEIGMFEDDDLSVRVRQAGYGVYAAEDCFIHHFGQGSFSKLDSQTYNRIFEANRKRFEEKWTRSWVAHRTRPGVRPAIEEQRFDPVEFARNSFANHASRKKPSDESRPKASGTVKIDLGCGTRKAAGFIGIDRYLLLGVDVIADMNDRLPFRDNSVDLLYASHSLEHAEKLLPTMKEIYRICKHGAQVCVLAPYYQQALNLANPYHHSSFNEHTPRFWTDYPHARVDPEEYAHPHAPSWGLSRTDNTEPGIDIRLVRMEFFYFPRYVGLPAEQLRRLRQERMDVCDQIMYHLIVWKGDAENPTDSFESCVARFQPYDPEYAQNRRSQDAQRAAAHE